MRADRRLMTGRWALGLLLLSATARLASAQTYSLRGTIAKYAEMLSGPNAALKATAQRLRDALSRRSGSIWLISSSADDS
jgi:hypothetical protein